MEIFRLPESTKVNKVIPKNAFDKYTNTAQKKLLTDLISRIFWTNKLSKETLNLKSKEITEIQVIEIELKRDKEIKSILDIIERAIPYAIIFVVIFNDKFYLTTSVKHAHPTNEDNAVIDWTFKTSWTNQDKNKYRLELKNSIDYVFHNFCQQLAEIEVPKTASFGKFVERCILYDNLKRQIEQIKSRIKSTKHFKKKVEFNIILKELEREISNKFVKQSKQ